MSQAAVPLSLLAGYLGAGKTTRLNTLLAHAGGLRIGVLVNDFGSVNVDARLVDHVADGLIGLANGCVCCSIADDLGAALERLARVTPPLEHVVLEASGVADPARLAGYARTWPGYRMGGTLVLADARRIRAQAGDKYIGETVRRQLGAAGQVVLTHTDGNARLVRDTAAWLTGVNGAARVVPDTPAALLAWLGAPPAATAPSDAPPVAAVHRTLTVERIEPLRGADVDALLARPPPFIERAKGWLYRDDRPGVAFRLQAVPGRWSLTPERRGAAPAHTTVVAVWSRPEVADTEVRALFSGRVPRPSPRTARS